MNYQYSILFILLMIYNNFIFSSNLYSSCEWKDQPIDAPEVFYINLDKVKMRRRYMEHHLTKVHLHYHRVSAITPSDIYIPEDVMNGWDTNNCVFQTSEKIPSRSNLFLNESSPYRLFSVIVEGLCGRKASMVELAVTLSHLRAIKQAIYSTSKNRYALIMEDDAHFLFNIDFKKLIASAPTDFGILQLCNIKLNQFSLNYGHYKDDKTRLWIPWFVDYGAGAYIIDKVALLPWIDRIVIEEDGWLKARLIVANNKSDCYPSPCCTSQHSVLHQPPCNACKARLPNDVIQCQLVADDFIYALVNSYTSPFPLLTNGLGSNISSIHQDHIQTTLQPIQQLQRQIYNDLMNDTTSLPSFLEQSCPTKLNEAYNE